MKTILLLLMVGLIHAISVDNEMLFPLNGDKIYLQLSGSGTLQVSRTKGIDFNVYYIQPVGIDGGWSMSIYDGAHPKAYEEDKLLGDVKYKIGDKEVVGKKYMGNNNRPFVVITDMYNKNDCIQVYIGFADLKNLEGMMGKVPAISIVRN